MAFNILFKKLFPFWGEGLANGDFAENVMLTLWPVNFQHVLILKKIINHHPHSFLQRKYSY